MYFVLTKYTFFDANEKIVEFAKFLSNSISEKEFLKIIYLGGVL